MDHQLMFHLFEMSQYRRSNATVAVGELILVIVINLHEHIEKSKLFWGPCPKTHGDSLSNHQHEIPLPPQNKKQIKLGAVSLELCCLGRYMYNL